MRLYLKNCYIFSLNLRCEDHFSIFTVAEEWLVVDVNHCHTIFKKLIYPVQTANMISAQNIDQAVIFD